MALEFWKNIASPWVKLQQSTRDRDTLLNSRISLSPLLQVCRERGGMRWLKATVGLVYIWSQRHLSSVGICFNFMRTSERLSYTDHMRCGGRIACWSCFSLQGVHQFKSSRLSDMSNRLSYGCHQLIIYWINY
jgi:hypothetical protein